MLPALSRRTYYRQPLTMAEVGPCRFWVRRAIKDALLPSHGGITVTNYALLADNATITIPLYAGRTIVLEMHVGAGYVHVPGQYEVGLTAVASNADAAAAIATAISDAITNDGSANEQQGTTVVQLLAVVDLLSWDESGRVTSPISGTAGGVTFRQPRPGGRPDPLTTPIPGTTVYPFFARSGRRRQFRQVWPTNFTPGP